jgi:hypothetical protein
MTATLTRARARNTDPTTSHLAAASVSNITATQEYVLRTLRLRPANDVEILGRYRNLKRAPFASESGIRTRRKELVDLGAIVDTGERDVLPSGRSATVWAINRESSIVREVFGK